MGNLFSSFDQTTRLFFILTRLNWLSSLIILFILPQFYWISGSQISKSLTLMYDYLANELSAIFSNLNISGNNFLFIRIFNFTLFTNFLGLFPYVFTNSSHLIFTLGLALPLWLGRFIWGNINQFSTIIAHLVPLGTPSGLMPVIVVIETVRNIIRPITLSVRLAANIVAGHLLLALLGSQRIRWLSIGFCILLLILVLLITLEVAVSCIQSYVFIILNSLYLKEINRPFLCKESLYVKLN